MTTTSRPEPGTTFETRTFTVTRTDLVRYAGASGDFNPIHHSDHIARAVGLPGVIGHGMLTLGLAARALTEWVGDAEIRELGAKFTRPVEVPDDGVGAELTVGGTVTKLTEDPDRAGVELATVTLEVRCADQKVLGAAKALVVVGGDAA